MREKIIEMEEYANEHNVPIIEKDSIAFIMKFIKANNVKSILEIGTAIGYSAILMAQATNDVVVTTIERDESRYMEALKNIKKCNLEDKITVHYQDALEMNLSGVSYDMIFITGDTHGPDPLGLHSVDGFGRRLNKENFPEQNGMTRDDYVIICGSKNLKQLVGKIENYIDFLKNNEEFETKFYDVGDGLSVSIKKNDI